MTGNSGMKIMVDGNSNLVERNNFEDNPYE